MWGAETMAVNKTLYVRDEDAPVWEKARELVGEKLSSFLTNYLKGFVSEKEAEAAGFERIPLNFREEGGLPRAVAFSGRWLIDPEESFDDDAIDFGPLHKPTCYGVAVTPKKNVAVFRFRGGKGNDGFYVWGVFDVVGSFELAAERYSSEVIATAMKRMGIKVQELDI
jgi:hypothetical protein